MNLKKPNVYQDFNQEKAIGDLSKAIQYKTISYQDVSLYDFEAFEGLHQFLEDAFPHFHRLAQKTVVNRGSLLYHLKGSDPMLKPVLFMAHLDVVSIVEGTEKDWVHDPFSGFVDDTYVWGRGALDTKCMVIGELSAIEYLLSHGFKPKRDIYFCYGHDEETQGIAGQWAISRILKRKNIALEYVLDEGCGFVSAKQYGADMTINPVGVFEKGYLDVKITAHSTGGHSSNPGKGTSLAMVCKAIAAIESHPFDAYLPEPLKQTFLILKDYITEEPLKTYVSDLNRYEKELIKYCYQDEKLNPFVHTTIATTMLSGASKSANVLPQTVTATVNLRTSEKDSIPSIIKRFSSLTENVEITYEGGLEPSLCSDVTTPAFQWIQKIVSDFVEGALVVPVLLCGGTDARYYDDLTTSSFRFCPFVYDEKLSATVHATNERMEKEGFIYGIKMLIDLIEQSC